MRNFRGNGRDVHDYAHKILQRQRRGQADAPDASGSPIWRLHDTRPALGGRSKPVRFNLPLRRGEPMVRREYS